MIRLGARIDPDGDLLLSGLPLPLVDELHRIPLLLGSDDQRIRDRLLPRTNADEESSQPWRRYVTPDLEHLFAARAETVRKDLRTIEFEDDGPGHTFRMRIPGRHRSAWQAALSGASHAIYQEAGLTQADMAADIGGTGDPERDLAVLRVFLLGMLLGCVLEAEGYSFPSSDDVDDWDREPG